MAAQQAAVVAKKGLGMMFSASKVAAAALSAGVQKARKGYANQHETSVLNELKARGLTPLELVVESLKRFYFLLLAGYKHEIQAAATLCAKRLTDSEKSTVPLDVVVVLGGVLYEESLKYGDFQKMLLFKEFEAEWEQMQSCFREAVTQTIEWAAANDVSPEARSRAAKAIYYLGQAVKTSAQQGEERRQKSIKDAETTLRTEQGRLSPHQPSSSSSPG